MGHNRFQWKVQPYADASNIIKGSNYRFTVLTPAMIRMEYDQQGIFEDRASQTVFYRNFKPVEHTVQRKDNILIIETEQLVLTYQEEEKFSAETLSIRLKKEPASEWCYSDEFEDLGGTARTLDGMNGEVRLGRGVCSRNGFSVIEDSHRMVLDEDGWVDVRRKDTLDTYFFGYGYDYLGAVKDYYRLTGVPAMLPAYALGNWWSRYHRYTQQEYIDLMERFKEEDIPFTVAVVDMDWHIVDVPDELNKGFSGNCGGWTGYSWNKELFPDYKAFLKYLRDNNLKTALNLHPSDGCRFHEDMYEEMCKVSGVDPTSKEKIPFDILSPKAMENYFDILLHPYEEDGVDFWWMDWQQGNDYRWIHEPNRDGKLKDEREVLNPLWMINHLHILDIQRNGKRPMFFSRFCGPGSQRYTIGFSGDTHVTWDSLDFQPYFTATASNIGYSWWSHDIGGHMMGCRDDELITRWIQLGVFSPINRLHSSDNVFHGKEPWNYGMEYEAAMRKYLRMRAELFPYIYTMNYRTHAELKPIIWPMYYSHPKCSAAYEMKNQYWFGSELMVAPITQPRNKTDLLGCVNVWFPKGVWFDFFHGSVYHSAKGRKLDVFRNLEDYPVFAKAGAIIPQTVLKPHSNKMDVSDEMAVIVFPGADNTFTLYEDEGEYYNCESGKYVTTEMTLNYSDSKAVFTIQSASGDTALIPAERKWNIKLRGFAKDVVVSVEVNGKPTGYKVTYEKSYNTTTVIVCAATNSNITVIAQAEELMFDNSDKQEKCFEILRKAQVPFTVKDGLYEIIKRKYGWMHSQIEAIYKVIPDESHLAHALKEQIALERDEFDGFPI
ncbi:MAG: DUF5110 domain-containing protein [Tyzzerella sp.]|nr:DUF5110 domain-containing protein [Tyzzerella sp.]